MNSNKTVRTKTVNGKVEILMLAKEEQCMWPSNLTKLSNRSLVIYFFVWQNFFENAFTYLITYSFYTLKMQ